MIPVAVRQGALLTDSAVAYYTVPAGDNKLKYIQLTGMRFCNTGAADVNVDVYIVPKNASAEDRYLRFSSLTIEGNASGNAPAYFIMNDVLLPGATIQAVCTTSGVVAISAAGIQYP